MDEDSSAWIDLQDVATELIYTTLYYFASHFPAWRINLTRISKALDEVIHLKACVVVAVALNECV